MDWLVGWAIPLLYVSSGEFANSQICESANSRLWGADAELRPEPNFIIPVALFVWFSCALPPCTSLEILGIGGDITGLTDCLYTALPYPRGVSVREPPHAGQFWCSGALALLGRGEMPRFDTETGLWAQHNEGPSAEAFPAV